jgi:hypothetical protein
MMRVPDDQRLELRLDDGDSNPYLQGEGIAAASEAAAAMEMTP